MPRASGSGIKKIDSLYFFFHGFQVIYSSAGKFQEIFAAWDMIALIDQYYTSLFIYKKGNLRI